VTKFYVTTPIYYVNDIPHIGHVYTTVAADILARFNRMLGKKVFFLTGTDEHGQKVQKAAQQKGLSPKEHADRMVINFQGLWERMNISYDAFIRTTDEEHKKTVQELLQKLYDKGEIVKRPYLGWYCTPDERFWTEKELVDGKCPECGRTVEQLEEDNYFFLMSKYQQQLIEYIEKNPHYILPETRRNEVLGFLKAKPLGDLCISRPKKRLSWGIPLPFDEEYVTYVWFDALINYYSATRYLAPDRASIQWWPAEHHIVGKDILTTHAVYWSTMLMALDMPLPKNIFAHGWWTVEGKKMSKSLGNVVDPNDVIDKYGVDAFRFFLFREVTFGLDGDFSEGALVQRINSELANDLGNLLQRSLAMVHKYFDSVVPSTKERETEIADYAEQCLKKIEDFLSVLSFNKALDAIWQLVDRLNKYIDKAQPWALAKEPTQRARLSTVLYTCLEGLRFIAMYIYPFMPETAEKIYRALGFDSFTVESPKDFLWGLLPSGQVLKKVEPLFPRIEYSISEKTKNTKETQMKESIINIDEFAKVHLKVGKIIQAEKVKGSKKLLRLIVDTGDRQRQVVAGIGKVYKPEQLVGKLTVVVTNLKPVKLMGVLSEGMLLAAGDEDNLSIVTLERDIPVGTRVK